MRNPFLAITVSVLIGLLLTSWNEASAQTEGSPGTVPTPPGSAGPERPAKTPPNACPENSRRGPFGGVLSVHVGGTYAATGLAIGPDAVLALLPASIKDAAPGSVQLGWFASQRRQTATVAGYDAGFGLALLRPDRPLTSCACLAEAGDDDIAVLVTTYGRPGGKAPVTLSATNGTIDLRVSQTDLSVVTACEGKDCGNRFIGGAVTSVRTGRAIGLVARSAGGRLYAARASFLRSRIAKMVPVTAASKNPAP